MKYPVLITYKVHIIQQVCPVSGGNVLLLLLPLPVSPLGHDGPRMFNILQGVVVGLKSDVLPLCPHSLAGGNWTHSLVQGFSTTSGQSSWRIQNVGIGSSDASIHCFLSEAVDGDESPSSSSSSSSFKLRSCQFSPASAP